LFSELITCFSDPKCRQQKPFYFLGDRIGTDVLEHHWKSLCSKINQDNLRSAIEWLVKQKPKKDGYYESFVLQEIYHQFLDRAGIRENLFVEQKLWCSRLRQRGSNIL
jgi:hypothetical protein